MASTRKSSRVRVPKIKEDGATPAKRSKPSAVSLVGVTPSTTSSTPAVINQPTVVTISTASVIPVASINILSGAMSMETGEDLDVSMSGSTDGATDGVMEENGEEKVATAVFKDPSFVHSSIGAAGSKRTRVWKNLKQIIATERTLPWENSYSSIEGPPSFKPAKKYSDLSGLEAPYTDPQTKIRYANPDEFSRVRTLPSDLVSGYLALRKASGPVP